MSTTFIYALLEGETVRYIGKANNPKRRFAAHLRETLTSHKNSWLLSLKQKGLLPTMEIVDEVPMSRWEFWEQHYICLYKSWGFPLVNMNEGGAGGSVLSNEAIAKVSKIHKGKTLSEEHKKIVGDAHRGQKLNEKQHASFVNYWKGKKQSEEHKAKRRCTVNRITDKCRNEAIKANVGRKLTEEHKAKISPLGRKHSAETKAKIGLSQKGKKPTPEALENQRIAQQARWQKAKQVNHIL